MSRLQETLLFNQAFVEKRDYENYIAGKFPEKKIVIVTCMDTRLTELLPHALNIKNGDAKLIKTAGAYVTHAYGSVMRSILVAVSLLHAEEIWVIGHHECGLVGLKPNQVITALKEQGIEEEKIAQTASHTDLEQWLSGPPSVEKAVKASVKTISNHELMPKNVSVHGLVIHPETGKLELVKSR